MSAVPPRAVRRAQTRQESRRHVRDVQRQREIRARRVRWGVGVGIAAVLVAAAAFFVIYLQKSQPGRFMQIQGAQHIDKGASHIAYNSKPPSSGPHWNISGEAPVNWGISDDPVPDEAQLHNLEHGGVMIQYNCRDCPELVTALKDFYNRYTPTHRLPFFPNSTKIVVAPYYDMPDRIALTAWSRIDTFNNYDEDRIVRFVEAYRDKGPEPVP